MKARQIFVSISGRDGFIRIVVCVKKFKGHFGVNSMLLYFVTQVTQAFFPLTNRLIWPSMTAACGPQKSMQRIKIPVKSNNAFIAQKVSEPR